MNLLFSIIIPVFNQEKTIGLLLSKLKSLSDNYSKEIIIVDSGSSDMTPLIIRKYKHDLSNFRLINIKREEFNHSETRNNAVKIAKGKYVCFLSGDAIPYNKNIFNYFFEDFSLDKKVVAVFGKHTPYPSTPIIQKVEVLCRFDKLDLYTNKKGILVQDLTKPFTPYNDKNRLLWYSLFNTFACYRRSFLLKYPFPKTDYFEDMLLGKIIIENGFIKIYDRRAMVIHSHHLNLIEYYRMQKEDFILRISKFKLKEKPNILCKVKKILSLKTSFFKKLFYLIYLFFYYFLKFIAVLEIKFRSLSFYKSL